MLKSAFIAVSAFIVGGFFFASVISADSVDTPTPSTGVDVGQDAFISEIMLTGANFCPRNWLPCEGQLLPINTNQALYSLLGTTYGGDGRTSFGLPDLRGRAAIGVGNGEGLPNVRQGEKGGMQNVSAPSNTAKALPNNPNLGLKYCICTQGIFPSRS